MQAKITPKKIAILRFSSIGDIVLVSPILRALYKANKFTLHFVTKSAFAQVNLHNLHLKKQHLFDKDPREILSELKKEDFDYVIDLQKNLRSRRLLRALDVKSSTFPKLNIKKWLLVNLKVDLLPNQHIVDRYFMATRGFDCQLDGAGLDMFIGAENQMAVSTFGLKAEKYTAIVLGAAHFTKRIPAAILEPILQGVVGRVALIGGPAEKEQGENLATLYPDRIHNFCGKTNLQQSASLIQQAKQVLTADTGMMHIAAAFHKKILLLWGNTVPKFGMYPYYGTQLNRAHSFLVPNLSCRPCSKIGFDACPKGHFDCMHKQDVHGILSVLNED